MSLVIKLVTGDFSNESRDKRELSVVRGLGSNVMVVAKGKNNSKGIVDGFEVHYLTTRPLGEEKYSKTLNKVVSLITWARYLRNLKADCISCHDLIALFIGWMSTWFLPREKKPHLVYDSHEFEIGRNTNGKRGRLRKMLVTRLEKFLIGKSSFSIMVNDSIADEVQRIHELKERPVVVRNIPNLWSIDEKVCRMKKEEILSLMGLPKDTFLMMYHGGVMPGRGIEVLLECVGQAQGLALVILGYGEKQYIKDLKAKAAALEIEKKVFFHDAVNIDSLWRYIGAADVGMVTIPARSKSYYYMLPNKFFENIQALTPIIGSNFPEIKKIIKQYDIGICVNPERADEIIDAIEKMRRDRQMYIRFKKNLELAKKELCWEKESRILEEAYLILLDKRVI